VEGSFKNTLFVVKDPKITILRSYQRQKNQYGMFTVQCTFDVSGVVFSDFFGCHRRCSLGTGLLCSKKARVEIALKVRRYNIENISIHAKRCCRILRFCKDSNNSARTKTRLTHDNNKKIQTNKKVPSIFFLSSSVKSATMNTAEGNFFILSNNTSTELNCDEMCTRIH